MTNMATSLIMHKRIRTTTAKAKALRKYVEPIINRSKENTTHNRRMAFRYLQDKAAVTELFDQIAAKVGDRPGGYTRILKLGNRPGDNAEMSFIELVDYNENMLSDKKKTRRSTRRRRGGGSKAAATKAEAAEAVEAKAEEAAEATAEAAEAAAEAVEETATEAAEAAETVENAAEEATDAAEDAAEGGEEAEEKKD